MPTDHKRNETRRKQYRVDPAIGQARTQRWRENNREAHLASCRRSNLKHAYGITEEDYDRMLVEQGGHCLACPRTPADEFHKRLFVDHNHTTKRIRGLLCSRCNSILGYCYEDPKTLHALADILDADRALT